MDFWNIAIPSIIFIAPILATAFFGLGKRGVQAGLYRAAAIVFGVGLFAALVGVVRFEQPVRLELLVPFSPEPSGYFEFAFQLHWMRFLWIAFAASMLLCFSFFDGPAVDGERRGINITFLFGAFLFSALAFLSENTFLSLLFIEVMGFLLYAFSVRAAPEEGELEKISYFKRSTFILMSLLGILGFAATGLFNVNSIILFGLVLYALSFLFSKHTFPAWRYMPLVILQAGALFFLLGRVMREGMAPELWVPLSAVFGLITALLAGFSLVALSNLGASFWACFSFVCYLFFLRFGSGKPDDQFWGAYEVVGLAAASSISQLVRYGRLADQGWKKALGFLFAGLLLAVVSGAIPGADAALTRGATDPVRLAALGVLTFLLSMVVGKALVVSFSAEPAPGESGGNYWLGLVPAALALLAEVGLAARIIDVYGENPYLLGTGYLVGSPLVIVAAATLLAGLLAGGLLGANSRYLAWAGVKERKMEDLFPRIDPSLIRWNEALSSGPDRFLAWAGGYVRRAFDRGAARVETADQVVFGDRLYRGFREYSSSLSLLVRYLHSGSVRAYLFMGILVTLFSSLLFLLEGR